MNSRSLRNYDFIVVFIACHGNAADSIYDNSLTEYPLRNLYNAASGVEDLENIPKIFLLNHCRGNKKMENTIS